MSELTREQLSVRLDTFEHKAIRLDRYANQDSNSMPHLRLMEQERDTAKDVIMAHDASLRAALAQVQAENARLREALTKLSTLGGGRSEGNCIAQEALFRAALATGEEGA